MPDLQIGDILLMPLIVAIVEAAKRYGFPVKYTPLLTAVLAVIGYGAVVTTDFFPEMMVWVQHGVNVVVIFLSAAGLYGVSKFALKQDPPGRGPMKALVDPRQRDPSPADRTGTGNAP